MQGASPDVSLPTSLPFSRSFTRRASRPLSSSLSDSTTVSSPPILSSTATTSEGYSRCNRRLYHQRKSSRHDGQPQQRQHDRCSTGAHLEAIFAALEALQQHQQQQHEHVGARLTPAAAELGVKNNAVQVLPVPSCLPNRPLSFSLRDGAKAWVCSRLELLWESAADAAAASFPTPGHFSPPTNDDEAAWRYALHASSHRTSSPSSPRDSNMAGPVFSAAMDPRSEDEACWDGERDADGVLRLASVRSRLTVRLLALDALRRRQRKRRRTTSITSRSCNNNEDNNNNNNARATAHGRDARHAVNKRSSSTSPRVAPMSELVWQWLWRRAAGLPRDGELGSLLVEWLSLELATSAVVADAAWKMEGVRAASLPETACVSPPPPTLSAEHLPAAALCASVPRETEVKEESTGKVEAGQTEEEGVGEEEEDTLLWAPGRTKVTCDDGTTWPSSSARSAAAVEESGAPLSTGAVAVAAAADSDALSTAATSSALCRSAEMHAFSEGRAPAPRVLQLRLGAFFVKQEIGISTTATPSQSPTTADLPVHNMGDNDATAQAKNGVAGGAQRGNTDNDDGGSTGGVNSSKSKNNSGGRRLTIQLFPRHTPLVAFAKPRTESTVAEDKAAEEAEEAEIKSEAPPSAEETATPQAKTSVQEEQSNDERLIGDVACAEAANNTEEKANAVEPKTYVDRQAQRQRWRRIAPLILYAPRGSPAASGIQTVLRALGFKRSAQLSTSAPSAPLPTQNEERVPCEPQDAPSPTTLRVNSEQTAAKDSAETEGQQTCCFIPFSPLSTVVPLCPLGRLPPLVAAYAWVHDAALRTAWTAQIAGVCWTAASSLVVQARTNREDHDPAAATAMLSFTNPPEQAPCAHAADAARPFRPPPRFSSFSPTLGKGHGNPCLSGEQCRSFFPCVAYADRRVAVALDDLFCVPMLTVALGGQGELAAAASSSVGVRFHLPVNFESNLHAYLCYPLAGVAAPHLEAAETITKRRGRRRSCVDVGKGTALEEGATPLTASAWRSYLTLRYGAPMRRRRSTRGQDDADADADADAAAMNGKAWAAPLGRLPAITQTTQRDQCCRVGGAEEDEDEGNREAAAKQGEPVTGDRADATFFPVSSLPPLLSLSTAAAAAADYVAHSSPVYDAVMDLSAVLLLAELRRICVDAVDRVHADAVLSTTTPSTASSAAMQRVLEAALEEDASLSCYAHHNANAFDTSSPAAATTTRSDVRLPRACPGCQGRQGEHAPPLSSDDAGLRTLSASTLSAAYAANLWLGLVAVLSLGESAIAQYVRSVLLPPPSLSSCLSSFSCHPTSNGAAAASASLAPFTMPTLFHSTLEDLYVEEAVRRSRLAPPLCVAQRTHFEHDDELQTVASTTATTTAAAAAAPMEECAVAVAAAVALRHPRVLLRQAHFLWCLSSRDSTTPKAAAEPGQRHSADLRSRDEKRAEDSYVRGNRNDDLQRACQQEFRSRIGMLAESLQLAACAGLLPPFAASLLPTCSSNGSRTAPARSEAAQEAKVEEIAGQHATQTDASPLIVAMKPQDAPAPSSSSSPSYVNPPPMTSSLPQPTSSSPVEAAPRPRLQLRLTTAVATTTAASPVPTLSSFSSTVAKTGADTATGTGAAARKRLRSPRLLLDDDNEDRELYLHPEHSREAAELGGRDGHCTPDKSDEMSRLVLPPLDGLADVQVRWRSAPPADTHDPADLARAIPSVEVPLLTLMSDVLWDALRHIHCFEPVAFKQRESEGVSLASATVAVGAASSAAAASTAHVGVQSDTQRPADAVHTTSTTVLRLPLRRTLMLRLAPGYVALQRLWQALRPAPSYFTSVFGSRGGAVLEVVLPPPRELPREKAEVHHHHHKAGLIPDSTASTNNKDKTSTSAGVLRVDLRHYASLVTTLRGVVGVLLGYAVYAVLHRIWQLWKEAYAVVEDSTATEQEDNNVHLPSTPMEGGGDGDARKAQQRRAASLTSAGSAASATLDVLTWLTVQLRAVNEEILLPLRRICTVYKDESANADGQHPTSEAQRVALVGRERRRLPLHGSLPLPSLVGAAWLSYRPFAHVLFPALIQSFDAALAHTAVTTSTTTTMTATTAAESSTCGCQMPAVQKCLNVDQHVSKATGSGLRLDDPPPRAAAAAAAAAAQRTQLERAEREARAAWWSVRGSLEQAGVVLPTTSQG